MALLIFVKKRFVSGSSIFGIATHAALLHDTDSQKIKHILIFNQLVHSPQHNSKVTRVYSFNIKTEQNKSYFSILCWQTIDEENVMQVILRLFYAFFVKLSDEAFLLDLIAIDSRRFDRML